MRLKRIRRFIRRLVASPDERLILEENAVINKIIEAKAFSGIREGKMYLNGVSMPELVSTLWPNHDWEHFPTTGGMVAITCLQILEEKDGTNRKFVGRLVVYLEPDIGLTLEILTKDSGYYRNTKALLQDIDPELLNQLKSLTIH